MIIHVAHANICHMPVDAVVSPTCCDGIMGDPIAVAIRKAAGDHVQADAVAAAPIAIGAAIVTAGGELPAGAVVCVPITAKPGGDVHTENLTRGVTAALMAAHAKKFSVMAIPAIGADVGGFGRDEAARAIVEVLRDHRRDFPEVVYLVDESDAMLAEFARALRA